MKKVILSIGVAAYMGVPLMAFASSHREAPFVTEHPKVDGTDLYMFTSYESGRSDYVTLIANYAPLQNPGDGPNYYSLDPEAQYDINIDNNGDAKEDLTFRFRFTDKLQNISVPSGNESVAIPLKIGGQVSATDTSKINELELYTVGLFKNGNEDNKRYVTKVGGGQTFEKPIDDIGGKSIPDYHSYANSRIYDIKIPGCALPGRVFVGQRKEAFVVNLGKIFDLVNLNPVGAPTGDTNSLENKNITSLALELPKTCVVRSGKSVISAWTTASLPKSRVLSAKPSFSRPETYVRKDGYIQVSRLGNPLVNELVIGLKDKDKFNSSEPKNDKQFLTYVTNPSLPTLLQSLFPGVTAPTTPRNDLVAVFLTGVPGLNADGGTGELMRLNTTTQAVPANIQNPLGVLGGDAAGYPNGRRLGDDVVDISLRAAMGALVTDATKAPSGQLPYTDGTRGQATDYQSVFPYLNDPIPGAPRNPA